MSPTTADAAAAPGERTTSTSTGAAPSGPARFVRSGPTSTAKVALTFHVGGDPAPARTLFDMAHEAGVPLTLFMIGTFVDANPDLVRAFSAEGHELANHTATHPTLGHLGRAGVAQEISGGRASLERAVQTPGRWFRPSGMDVPTALVLDEAGRAGYDTVVGYDLDPHDYQDPGRAAVLERVRNGVRAGSIVSLHAGHQGTIDAFPDVVQVLRSARLQPATVTDLLASA